jgi:hypothetical protein
MTAVRDGAFYGSPFRASMSAIASIRKIPTWSIGALANRFVLGSTRLFVSIRLRRLH